MGVERFLKYKNGYFFNFLVPVETEEERCVRQFMETRIERMKKEKHRVDAEDVITVIDAYFEPGKHLQNRKHFIARLGPKVHESDSWVYDYKTLVLTEIVERGLKKLRTLAMLVVEIKQIDEKIKRGCNAE